jgi:hypothetical protein
VYSGMVNVIYAEIRLLGRGRQRKEAQVRDLRSAWHGLVCFLLLVVSEWVCWLRVGAIW